MSRYPSRVCFIAIFFKECFSICRNSLWFSEILITQNEYPPADLWSEWLLRRRHGGNPNHEQVIRGVIERIRDRVLDGAALSAGMTLVDVGAGDGLIAFGALERIGLSLRVVFTDLSVPLLQHAEKCAIERGVRDCCTFLQGSAERLEGIVDESVDVVTSRAVLAYVANKAAAVGEFYRVLKPGGRISIAEPIFRDEALQIAAHIRYLEAKPACDVTAHVRLMLRCKAAQFPSTTEEAIKNDPLINFSERDLVGLCQSAGFGEIHLELHIDVRKAGALSWDTFIDMSPHPRAPTIREILASHFSDEEQRQYEEGLRPLVESGQRVERDTIAYLTAIKPR